METGYLNHYVITLNSNAIRDAQLYCGTSSEPWNDEDGWDDIKHVTPYLGIRRFRDAADMEEARKDIAEEYGCAPEKVDICPLTLLPNEEASAVLNSKADNAADFARTILSEAEDSLTSYAAMGRAILEALASNDADKLLTALTGWSAHDLLVKVGALPDEEQVFSSEEEKTLLVRVRQWRTRQEGFRIETYVTEVYMTVPASLSGTQMTESYLRDRFMAPLKEFMSTVAGQKAWSATCNDFNWGDWCTEIPTELLNKHGICWSGDASSVSDSLVWNVNQAETIGYGVDEMSDEERSSFYQELAANFIDMAADEVEGHPDKYPDVNADEVDLNALRREENKDLRSMVADALSDDDCGVAILSSSDTKECVHCVWATYKRWRSGQPE